MDDYSLAGWLVFILIFGIMFWKATGSEDVGKQEEKRDDILDDI